MINVSVIIVNYNTFKLTCDCIDSIQKNTEGINYEIILVDNNSSSFNSDEFQKAYPDVLLIMNKTNTGFAKGNNLGILRAKGKYILLLNSDTLLKENSVKIIFDYLVSHSKVAVVSPRLIYPNGNHQPCCQKFPSIRYKLFELFRLNKILSKKTVGKVLLASFFDYSESIDVDWVWGTCFMFNKELLKSLPQKKLNEDYFMYYEDMQWCLDFRKLGYQIHYCADTEVIHLMGGSSANKNEMMNKNSKLFLQRNYNYIHRKIFQFLDFLLIDCRVVYTIRT
jgi:GT2 family glycosyltransferase